MKPSKIILLTTLLNTSRATVSNWDIATCYQENQIIYAETNQRVVVSPNYPSSIPAHTDSCTYSLTARSPSSVISIEFKSFNLKESNDCNQQRIIIIDEQGSNRAGPFCGTKVPAYTSSGHTLKVQFISSGTAQGSMFAFSFVAMDKMELSQARSAFDSFDRARGMQSGRQGGGGRPGGQSSYSETLSAFDNIRQGRPVNSRQPSISMTGNSLIPPPTVNNEPALISSSGIRLGGALHRATKTSSKYNPESNDSNEELADLNNHLKVVGHADPNLRGNFQAKRTLKRYQIDTVGVAQVKGGARDTNSFFEVESNLGDIHNSKQTYRTQQEFENAIQQEENNKRARAGAASSIGPSRTDSLDIGSVSTIDDSKVNNIASKNSGSTHQSGILLSDRFIPSSFISRGKNLIEGNTYLLTKDAPNSANDNEAMHDPIKSFFLEWNITKIFIAGLIGLIMLLILVAFCRWRFNVWIERREALRNAKLVAEISAKKTNPVTIPTYKSVLKTLASREQSQNSSPDETYIINSSNSSIPSCPTTNISDIPYSIKTSQTYIPSVVSGPAPVQLTTSSGNFVDPNGVNPALEREKSRKHFLGSSSQIASSNNMSRLGSFTGSLDHNSAYPQTALPLPEIPIMTKLPVISSIKHDH